MSQIQVLAGTKKGLFILSSADRKSWELHGPFLNGKEVNHAIYHQPSGKIFATSNDAWFGSEIVSSGDGGNTWKSAALSPAFAEDGGLKVERLWHLSPGHEAGELYAGVAPAALFKSTDSGETWQEVTSLTKHPTRDQWNPGAGGMCLHSIVVDPGHKNRMYVGISAAGVFRTEDGGASWQPANQGTRAGFLPDPYPEVGQCVHKLLAGSSHDGLLFQQNHCGVYRSRDAGVTWTEITAGLPSEFGFPLGIHPREPETLYVLPLQGPEFRCPPEGKLKVYISRDGGDHWTTSTNGLPQQGAFPGVYRESMAVDAEEPSGLYFGTNNGKIFGSVDGLESWNTLAENLPPVFSIEVARF